MDSSAGTSYVAAEGDLMMLRKSHIIPKLSVPSKSSGENLFSKASDGASPSPMTFVSSLFADDPYPDKSFSHLLSTKDQMSDPNATGSSSAHGSMTNPHHTARFKLMVPAKLPIRRSACLTIPPGLSPTTLLDSPVLFSNAEVQLSPTTGACRFTSLLQRDGPMDYLQHDANQSFAFKPHQQLPLSPLSNTGPFGMSNQQESIQMQTEAQGDQHTTGFDSKLMVSSTQQAHAESTVEPENEPAEKVSTPQAVVSYAPQPLIISRPSEDGFNWRKYGQKTVKGSEFPRSYYKCTFPNCDVKKKVERSYDGQITEIVYKGEHTHPKPQSTRRSSSHSMTDGGRKMEDAKGAFAGTPEPSLGSVSEDEAEDGDASKLEDYDEDDPECKRRRMDEALANAPLRTVREPRVVVQTTSEVDILDDGYRWRKYGQKVVKGNAHPRSYYKCTNVGCSVRKQVERSSKDPKAVITTYEGKHNHDVPVARNGAHHETATPPLPSDANTSRPVAISLQEQVLGNNFMGGMEPSNGSMHRPFVSEPGNAQRGNEQYQMDMMVPHSNGMKSFSTNDFFQQSFGFMPKEEPGELNMMGSSVQSMYKPNPFASRFPT